MCNLLVPEGPPVRVEAEAVSSDALTISWEVRIGCIYRKAQLKNITIKIFQLIYGFLIINI